MSSIHRLHTLHRERLADTVTPVSAYLRLRDTFAINLLLESSDYHTAENSFSYLCCEPIASISVEKGQVLSSFPDGSVREQALSNTTELPGMLREFSRSFAGDSLPMKFAYQGLFGYQSYDVVRHYETVTIDQYEDDDREIPDLLYYFFRFVLVFDHFHNKLYLFEHRPEGSPSRLHEIEQILDRQNVPRFQFATRGPETTPLTDEDYLQMVRKGISHCQRGDVFQIVLSRQFRQGFEGDEFNVYRALRSINPSPYLFYGDFGSFKLMGSSPEAQLVIHNNKAVIHPIAGTFRRTGRDSEDLELARRLAADPKENAEHVMLVDLARNDLSRHGYNVQVDTYKEIQYYSHVIHLVSRVSASIAEDVSPLQLVADTFPAGTLSGAPKHMAMQLINRYEPHNRGFYGGCIGFLGLDGSFNHAIMIRSFLSKGNVLHYQAGAGVVSKSIPDNELQEVHNKLAALRQALHVAEEISSSSSVISHRS
ncbi:MAG: anthranilate synthase component I family protein [Bacteroidia bacterium]|nr:anthranilate synthase component I family protein [Bacteroidia bacterium]